MQLTYLLKVMLYYGYFTYTMRLFMESPRGETMNVRGCTTGEMWIDLLGLTNPTRRLGRAGAYCLLLLARRGIGYSQNCWASLNNL